MTAIVIPSEYGYVLAVAVASTLHLFSIGFKVSGARKAAKVPYPYAYAERSEAEKDPKKNIFNCAQRAHQNSLELFPIFSTLLLVGGLKYPQLSAGAGAFFLLGRMFYVNGYVSGEPSKRMRGIWGMFGIATLLGTSCATVYHLLSN
ncbi:hypothetical protein BDF20DRAFT_822741 [Mycotypha africana]|uniref:uncharacterized protein n=1 Tax=Mycotypha africana TaxID=64632 RepID=UPI002300E5A2|nr:uncharacterized protein BDF20DRAFT_822741 [Mycotypha africana]KAI8975520.1 hypothetical protein BDF20DRAFT_822741 [Mycotypha africana]